MPIKCNRGDTILHHGGLHTDLNQCNQGSYANIPVMKTGFSLQGWVCSVSQLMLSTFLNRINLVYGRLSRATCTVHLIFAQDQPVSKRMNHYLEAKCLLRVYCPNIYTLAQSLIYDINVPHQHTNSKYLLQKKTLKNLSINCT